MSRLVHHKRTSCRACDSNALRPYLSLGAMPLANSFLRSPREFADEPFYPLDVYFCETCSLVQLLDVIDPEVLFRNYIYVTGTSETINSHNGHYSRSIVDLLQLHVNDRVMEIASNDGSLLKCFNQLGMSTLGIEPATNIAKLACDSGIDTINCFFDSTSAQQLRESYGLAKALIANNVLAHVDDPQDFLRGCRTLLEKNGLVIIEVPYLRELIKRLEYDTIYHEHLCYFSVNTLIRLCDAAGLCITQIDHVPVHGGSLRIFAGSREQYGSHSEDVLALGEEERASGLTRYDFYRDFAADVENNRLALIDLLEKLTREGKTIAGYGAPAKGSTLLNYCGIDTRIIPYTVDKNPLKVGLYTPGVHIPVLPVSTLHDRQPDYLLILAWNFAEEIMKQQKNYRERGGKFLVPIPEPMEV